MHLFKTTLVTLTAATLLFLVWISVLVHSIKPENHSRAFGNGLLITPIVSIWFWVAVIVVGGLYYRFSR